MVEGYATTFQQALQMLVEEYNSSVRHTRVKNYRNSIQIIDFAVQGTETSAALEKIYKAIIKFSR